MDANERLIRAVHVATRKLSSTGDVDRVLNDVLSISVDAVGAGGGTIYLHDDQNKVLRFQHVLPVEVAHRLPVKDIPDRYGVAGRVFQTRRPEISEFQPLEGVFRTNIEEATGVIVRSMITVPLMMEGDEPIGVVQLINKEGGPFTETDTRVLEIVAAVSTMAILNSRLMDEATRASSLLGMGKVSHDIANLAASLYAGISYSELAVKGLKEHVVEGHQSEMARMYVDSLQGMLLDLKMSVDRIVGYSHLISDLSAGRELRPNKVVAPLSASIQAAAAYLETEGFKNHVAIRYDIDETAPPFPHDELYIFRIVQNLVGNAIKAVRDTIPPEWEEQVGSEEDVVFGEVKVAYRFEDGFHVLEVADSGPGMPPEVSSRILSGTARSRWSKGGGSGWGTKIVLELAATHYGEVSIDSTPGKGSTFRVRFPHLDDGAA